MTDTSQRHFCYREGKSESCVFVNEESKTDLIRFQACELRKRKDKSNVCVCVCLCGKYVSYSHFIRKFSESPIPPQLGPLNFLHCSDFLSNGYTKEEVSLHQSQFSTNILLKDLKICIPLLTLIYFETTSHRGTRNSSGRQVRRHMDKGKCMGHYVTITPSIYSHTYNHKSCFALCRNCVSRQCTQECVVCIHQRLYAIILCSIRNHAQRK